MNEQTKRLLKRQIDEASLISFDIFDTLLFRRTNTPETVFDLVGRHFGIYGFRKMRIDAQNEASTRAYAAFGYPHADMNQIYEVLSERKDIPVDWLAVKDFEIRLEKDALAPNTEMLEIFRYAKNQGKRVVITSDMYLLAETLADILKDKGFGDYDYLYCSADEHTAKFNKLLFETVSKKENVPYGQILHIGDKERDDGVYPAEYGIKTFVYHRDADLNKIKDAPGSDVDKGLYKILCDGTKGFWYELGVEVGGPVYMGLYRWLRDHGAKDGKKIFLLARDGYNLYHLFKQMGAENVEYLYASRRALTLASITRMDQRDIDSLPPYTLGQTVGEILDYLCVDREKICHLAQTGLESFDRVIGSLEDIAAFKKLYELDREVFLERCAVERENALEYFRKVGFLDGDAVCFDCGWQGSSQDLIERFKEAVGCTAKHFFVYYGIKSGEKSCRQLRGMHYDTYLFDFYKNFALQADLGQNVVMYELLFSAPHESVYYYGENGEVVFEQGEGDREKEDLLRGICDFIREGLEFVDQYGVEYTPEISVGHLKRLIHLPTEEEAVTIGNLQNVDGFARKQGEAKYIAYVTREQLEKNSNTEIYWIHGLLKRPDVPEDIKTACAARMGVQYPAVIPEYHLEDEQSIRNYHRWLMNTAQIRKELPELVYQPMFSVVIPVYNTVTPQLEECIRSVLNQSYRNFELILVDDHSSWENVVPVLRKYEKDPQVRVIYRSTNGHISVATNDGIAIATGEFIVFMDCDDVIHRDALCEFAAKLNENRELDFIYSDEDKLTEDGKIRHMPFFKPDWSPDLFLNMMYTNHLATYRTSLVREVGGLRTAFNGSQDYDFTLRFMERSDNTRVGHVPKVLYHWRERKESVAFAMTSKNYAAEAARYAKEDYIRRNGLDARLEIIPGMHQYRIVYEPVGDPLVSIIIPSKDHPGILKQCIDSIRDYTDYPNYEIIVVDNGSSDYNRQAISGYLNSVGATYLYDPAPFNFSKMCNTGAAAAKGAYLLFLNDDIEMFQPDWLRRMLGQGQRAHIGAVGAKLYYPQSTTIQHTGVSNTKAGPVHSFWMCDDRNPYYFGWNRVDNNCIAVTGACLLVSAEKFREVGGYDESLPVAYNDVKLCFALHSKGYYNVIRNDVVAYHHESLSRGGDQENEQKLIRLNSERARLFSQFPELRNRDPFMNRNLELYGVGLNMRYYHAELKEMNLKDCVEVPWAAIDYIHVTDRIQVIGWSYLEGVPNIGELERYVVFRDPFGHVYGARALPFSRPDVAATFGNPDYVLAGFETTLRREALRIDLMVYQTGVLTIGSDGVRYLTWCRPTDIIRNPEPRPMEASCCPLPDFCLCDNGAPVHWSLDACENHGQYSHIRGFAFVGGGVHYRYTKTLVLTGAQGHSFALKVQPEERLDVAYTFPHEHFLYYTGFVCYIYEGTLEPGEYDVTIRLQNQFRLGDIKDIPTGKKLTV